ncbi:DUF2750 domain-containing protein [Acanthopleuribacter pedis]|uniref:DUF2750 domain-containing protein n=1 Tax=Acanthopleuribacter pedis TaxID=442870 RepID=A0A8J7QFX4_9BACT|nr:DUF2750 domain-containing protein [Acanthopleuribacter pedis]
MSKKKTEGVLVLPAPKQHSRFVRKVVCWRGLWALYDYGQGMSEASNGNLVIPLWPEKEHA